MGLYEFGTLILYLRSASEEELKTLQDLLVEEFERREKVELKEVKDGPVHPT